MPLRAPINPFNVLLRVTFSLFLALSLAIPLAFSGVAVYLALAGTSIPLEASPTTSRWMIGLVPEAHGSGAYDDLLEDSQREDPDARFYVVGQNDVHHLVIYARADDDSPFRNAQLRTNARGLSNGTIVLPTPLDFLQPGALESLFEWLSKNPGAILGALSSQGVSFLILGGLLIALCRRKGFAWITEAAPRSQQILYGIGGGLALVALSSLLEATHAALGKPVVEQAWVSALLNGSLSERLVLWTIAVCIAPLGEELFFRGYLFQSLDVRVGSFTAYALSVVYFAGVHANPSAFTVYLVLGAGLAWLHRSTRSLLAPILAHMVVNAASLVFGAG